MTDTNDSERLRMAQGADGVEQVRDITLGSARPEDYSATDTAPVADASVADLRAEATDGDPADRRRAVLALAERDADDVVREDLATLARTDPDDQVRQFAVEALAKVGGDPAVARELLAEDDDQWVRAEATVALDRMAREEHEAVFEDLLDDEASAVRRNALISLTRIRGEATREACLHALEDPDDRVREWAAKLLGAHDEDPEVEAALVAVAEDETEVDVVRETAARSLGETGQDVASLVDDAGSGTEMAGDHMLNQVPDR